LDIELEEFIEYEIQYHGGAP